jgi:hypothetical protein
MRKLLLSLMICFSCAVLYAQEVVTTINLPAETPNTFRVYAELLGRGTNLLDLNKNVIVQVDLGQFQSAFKYYNIVDEEGKNIKFNSMVAAMNYMGERGWKFVQAYIITVYQQNVYHWLLYKDVTDISQIYDRLMISNTDSAPEKPKKGGKDKPKKARDLDGIYD